MGETKGKPEDEPTYHGNKGHHRDHSYLEGGGLAPAQGGGGRRRRRNMSLVESPGTTGPSFLFFPNPNSTRPSRTVNTNIKSEIGVAGFEPRISTFMCGFAFGYSTRWLTALAGVWVQKGS